MAERYRSTYSPQPGGTPAPPPASVARAAPGVLHHRYESRATWIMLAAVPMLIGAFFQAPVGMALNLAGFGLLGLGMFFTREGLRAQATYESRRVARRPALPRKLFGSILTGIGIAVGAGEPAAWAGAVVLGGVATVLHALAFGPDPMRDKGMEGVDSFQQDRAARMVDEAEGYLRAMSDAILRTRDRQLEARVNIFAATARDLFRQVEEDPATLTAARRYLGVYLMGARDATVRFADLYAQTRDPRARSDYEALLDDLERSFREVIARARAGSRTNMDIEISVLRDRLAREGVRMPAETPLIGTQPLPDLAHELFAMPEPAAPAEADVFGRATRPGASVTPSDAPPPLPPQGQTAPDAAPAPSPRRD